MALLTSASLAQHNGMDEKLAMQFLRNGEPEKAIVYLDKLYDDDPQTWYQVYYQALLTTKDYSRAEKITKRQLRQNPQPWLMLVNLGRISGLQNDAKKEKEYYEKAIRELRPIQPYVNGLANSFKDLRLYDYAIQVYNKGRKDDPDYPYFYERAEIYKAKRDYSAMINEYLDAIEFRDTELSTAMMQLQNSLGYDDESGGMKNPLLRKELQKRIDKNPGNIVLTEFLVFILKQQKDFDGAFVQLRALDKRMKEDGGQVFELGRTCVSNEAYETAVRCFDYVISKGETNTYHDLAAIEKLNAQYKLITQQAHTDMVAARDLESKLQAAAIQHRGTLLANDIVRNLATLDAYYLDKPADAIRLLEEHIASPSLDQASKAPFKLLLGDIYLVSGNIWDASLLYSQVEKAFKFETIGHEAKFRNARLSYYAGDFKWAKAQADVLKGSVEKLIANDALDLSLVISDAIGVDTNEVPLRMFASAELLVLQNKYDQGIARMDSINLLFPGNTLGDDISFKKARIYRKLGKLNEAVEMYKNVLEYYPDGLYGDDSQFELAKLYENDLKDKAKAQEAYQQVLTKYPGSIFTTEARKRYRELRGDELSN